MQSKSMFKQAVFGIVFDEKRSEVLLVKRRDIPVWVPPGGGLEPEETAEAAVVREVLEETGYSVCIRRKVAEYLPVNWMTQFTHVFECSIVSGESRTGKETQEVRFFPVTALPKLLPPFYAAWIEDALADYPHLLRKKIEGITMRTFFKFLFKHPLLVMRYLLTKLGIHFNT